MDIFIQRAQSIHEDIAKWYNIKHLQMEWISYKPSASTANLLKRAISLAGLKGASDFFLSGQICIVCVW